MGWTVGEVARAAGVSVRTLHHYDEIGLVSPSGRTAAGYRHYGYDDLQRLQQVLAYRELGFPLEQVAALLDDPAVDTVDHLRRRHAALIDEMERLRRIVATLERTMEAHRMGIKLTAQEMFEVFGEHDPTQYADEVRERWGETDAYRESNRRTPAYGKQDWQRIQAEADGVLAAYAAAYGAGLPATSAQAVGAAEQHRLHISRAFYECSPAMHRALGDMYVADERFAAYYDKVATGLAVYVRDAIHANADRSA